MARYLLSAVIAFLREHGADPALIEAVERRRGRSPKACPDPSRLREPARALVAAWGVSLSVIARWRGEHGVVVPRGHPRGPDATRPPSRPPTPWPAPGTLAATILPLLGTESDGAIARRFGASRARVQQIRARAGIAKRAGIAGCPDPSRLGTVADTALAQEWGVSRPSVRRWRTDARIAPAPVPRVRATPAADALAADPDVGRVPDRVIAERHGVAAQTIIRWRQAHGVAPSQRGPSEEGRRRIAESQRARHARR